MTFTHALSTNNYGPAKFIVDSSAANGTHTTIASALTSASSGDTIFIRPGTYTENITLKAGVNIVAFLADAFTPNVTIVGTCTLTTAGTVSISGIRLQTNSAALISVTGTAASILKLYDCYLNCTNSTGITFSSSDSSANLQLVACRADIGTTGISLFSHSSSGNLRIDRCIVLNSGGTSTASTVSAGSLNAAYSSLNFPITVSNAATATLNYCDQDTSVQNVTCFTSSDTSSLSGYASQFKSGTASAISIAGTGSFYSCLISSANTNAITGAGTLNYCGTNFTNTSRVINTTTQVGLDSGTWTPGVSFGGGTTGITYALQSGIYTRVNNIIYVAASVTLTSKGSSTGAALITGLPIAAAASFSEVITIGFTAALTYTGTYINGLMTVGGTTIRPFQYTSVTGGAQLDDTNFADTTSFRLSGWYTI